MLRKILFVLVLAILLSGCAEGTSQATIEITVEATEFAYNPITITVSAGEPITLKLKNSGSVEHDFVIEEINVSNVAASETGPAEHHQMDHESDYDLHFFAKAGETATLQFIALEPGTYEIFCSIAGHKDAGMVGQLVVAARE
jgi:uncharacterized cupredoxin-like copper-binding protein